MTSTKEEDDQGTPSSGKMLVPKSTGPILTGWVNFCVKKQGLVIEFMRDGQRMNGHIARFKQDGRFYLRVWSGEVSQYILLDFRTTVLQTSIQPPALLVDLLIMAILLCLIIAISQLIAKA